MRENVKMMFYANKSGGTMAKGYMPAQLGNAAMVKVWVESNLIDRFDLWKDPDATIHYVEGRGYIIDLGLVDWTFCQPDTAMYRLKDAALQFIQDFDLKKEYSLVNVDYAMEVVVLSRDNRKYSLHQYGNHMYGIDVKHTTDIRHEMMCPLSIDDSDWIGERG
jgi:hypothetical protein